MANGSGSGGREAWGTRIGVILAVMGSAVGLGNFLRFPGEAARFSGGAFMIPYAIGLLLLGLPLALGEWSMGRFGGRKGFNSSPGIYRSIWGKDFAAYFGVLGLLVPVGIYMYYVFIEAWCLGYAWYYATGMMPNPIAADPGEAARWSQFVGYFFGLGLDGTLSPTGKPIAGDGLLFLEPMRSALIFVLISFALNFVLIYRGLTKGIEWFCKWAMPALVLLALVVLVRVLTLGAPVADHPERNVITGLAYMWNPGYGDSSFIESLKNPEMWLRATGQIFFSLSVGFGIIITYSSYLKKDDDVALSSLTAAAGNEFCEVALGGMMVVPAAFIFLGAIDPNVLKSGFVLGFLTLPKVFAQMPGGDFFGFAFFFLLFLAAVTSSLSMLQPAIALLEEGLGLARAPAVALLGFITAIGTGFVLYFTTELYALDTLDFWVGTFSIFVLATFQVLLFGWVLGPKRGLEEIDRGAEVRIPRFIGPLLKYVSPVYLLAIFALWCWYDAPGRVLAIFGYKMATEADIAANMAQHEGQVIAVYRLATQADVTSGTAAAVGDPLSTFSLAIPLSLGFAVLVAILFAFLIAQSIRRWRRMELNSQAVAS